MTAAVTNHRPNVWTPRTIAENLVSTPRRVHQAIKSLGLVPIDRIDRTTVYSNAQFTQIRAWIKNAPGRGWKKGRSRKGQKPGRRKAAHA